jgi:WD40 repeat protein
MVFLLVVGVAACVVLVGLIIGALKVIRPAEAPVADSASDSGGRLGDRQSGEDSSAVSVALGDMDGVDDISETDTEDTSSSRPFYSAAIDAPPLEERELMALPQALGYHAPVTNPLPLPGVRSWTVDTVGYRVWGRSAAISHDGRFAAIATGDDNLRVLDLKANRLDKVIVGGGWQNAFTPDNRFLVRVNNGGLERLDLTTARATHIYPGVTSTFATTSDYQQIYAVSQGRLHVLSATDLSELESLAVPERYHAVIMSPNDEYFACRNQKEIAVYRNTRPPAQVVEVSAEIDAHSAAVSSEGVLAIGWTDGRITVHDHRKSTSEPTLDMVGYTGGYLEANCCAWIDNDTVLTTGTEQFLGHLDVRKGRFIEQYIVDRWHPTLTYNNSLRRGIVIDDTVRLLRSGKMTDSVLAGDANLASALAFSPDGRSLFVNGEHEARINLQTGRRVPLKSISDTNDWMAEDILPGRSGVVCGIQGSRVEILTPDGNGGMSGTVFHFIPEAIRRAVWSESQHSVLVCTVEGKVRLCRSGHTSPIPVEVPNGESIVDVGWDSAHNLGMLLGASNLYALDPNSLTIKAVCPVPAQSNQRIEVSRDGRHIALAGGQAVVIETTGYSVSHTLPWQTPDIRWVTNDQIIGITLGGNTLYRADLQGNIDEQGVGLPWGHGKRTMLAVSPVAPVAAGLHGGMIRFIDLRNGSHLGTILSFRQSHAMITPEGRIVGMSPRFRDQLVYVIETDDGQETLTPRQFERRFGRYFQ